MRRAVREGAGRRTDVPHVQLDPRRHDLVPPVDARDQPSRVGVAPVGGGREREGAGAAEGVREGGVAEEVTLDGEALDGGRGLREEGDNVRDLGDCGGGLAEHGRWNGGAADLDLPWCADEALLTPRAAEEWVSTDRSYKEHQVDASCLREPTNHHVTSCLHRQGLRLQLPRFRVSLSRRMHVHKILSTDRVLLSDLLCRHEACVYGGLGCVAYKSDSPAPAHLKP